MVEIASRALSPGINDPFTAIVCIDNLTTSLSYLAKAQFPSNYTFNENEELKIIGDMVDFEGILDSSFNQIRQFAKGNTAVIIRLMEALITISEVTTREQDVKAVNRHANMVLNIGKTSIEEKNDIEDLLERARLIC